MYPLRGFRGGVNSLILFISQRFQSRANCMQIASKDAVSTGTIKNQGKDGKQHATCLFFCGFRSGVDR